MQCDDRPGCTVAPISAKFYPFWSLGEQSGALGSNTTACVWNFGNDQPNTVLNFGKDAQYGKSDVAHYGGTIISAPMSNPAVQPRLLPLAASGRASSAPGCPACQAGHPRRRFPASHAGPPGA